MKKGFDRKQAFTLAEVLITLGIIGIIAALTLPAIVGNYRKKSTVAQLKKLYSSLNQAMKMSEIDNGEYQYWQKALDMGAENYINKYWTPYFKVLTVCTKQTYCGYSNNYPWVNPDGSSNTLIAVNSGYRIPFYINDGVLISVSKAFGGTTDDTDYIFADINGPKAPNKYGIDFFAFERTSKGVLPACNNKTEREVNLDCAPDSGQKAESGFCCLKKIINDGWEIKDDYPWK